jgi:hypothetical protein
MYFKRPVIACASGGPLESVLSAGSVAAAATSAATGFLIGPTGLHDTVSGAEPSPAHDSESKQSVVRSDQYSQRSAEQTQELAKHWAQPMLQLVQNPALATQMGTRY